MAWRSWRPWRRSPAGRPGLCATENRITVVNHSGQPIALVLVSGSPSCVKFENLPDGGGASAPFRIEGDGSFYIHGRMWDGVDCGTEFGGRSYGYVTRGVGGGRVRFVIERGGEVVFSQG